MNSVGRVCQAEGMASAKAFKGEMQVWCVRRDYKEFGCQSLVEAIFGFQ